MPPVPHPRSLLAPVLLPAGIYLSFFLARPLWFKPWCATEPTPCTVDRVNALDRIAFGFQSVFADFLSNLLQNSVGVAAFALPWLLIRRGVARSLSLNLALLSATAWNGVIVEIVRALVQRPRPLVFRSPTGDGANIHQYTSFYSGHTSFVALALLMTCLSLQDHLDGGKKRGILVLAWFAYPALTLLTASLRVIGGRHYPSDTLAGFFFGSLVGWAVYQHVTRRNIFLESEQSS
jgi:membrane-associated phospholipid phosphatase